MKKEFKLIYTQSILRRALNRYFSKLIGPLFPILYFFIGSSRIVVELGEADQDSLFKVDKIPKSVTHAFHCLDRIVNALNDTCGHPIYKVV